MAKKFTEEEFQSFVVEQFGTLHAGLIDLRTEVREGFREVHTDIEELKRTLASVEKAVDKDAETLVEHERRLGRLETHGGISRS